MNSQEFTKTILERIQAELKPLGFRKRGSNFSKDHGDVVLLIQLQKSMKTTKITLVGTINLGIFSRLLASHQGQRSAQPTIVDCHWEERIGFLLPERRDKWWEIHNDSEADLVGEEIAQLLQRYGLPALDEVSSTAKLKALWQAGQSPGRTERERQDYLRILGSE